jgi:hypothetical protein
MINQVNNHGFLVSPPIDAMDVFFLQQLDARARYQRPFSVSNPLNQSRLAYM